MITKKFAELADETVFTINGTEYKKVAPVRISCCKTINALNTSNASNNTFIQPTTDVEVNE